MIINQIKQDLQKLSSPKKAEILSRFFKTGKGQYGEDDVFLGLSVADIRKISKEYSAISLNEIESLLSSRIHEHRIASLFILIEKYKRTNNKEEIFNFYLKNLKCVNNWDLVDLTAPSILGDFLLDKDTSILYKLAESKNLWERRIAILSTFTFIKNNQFEDTLKIAEILLKDKHDLIHKAVGWMLREIGKRNQEVEEEFLKKHYKKMPRTMLRYAIEKFSADKRNYYLNKD